MPKLETLKDFPVLTNVKTSPEFIIEDSEIIKKAKKMDKEIRPILGMKEISTLKSEGGYFSVLTK